ncbi:MAG: hypothetical protein KC729_19120 [Candidatus Eisenbacteria bacterium]|uniref:Capsid protein n=1 Tax=Eiseniibacteriota bacterium TaxID=2212470 RepID=A0A956M2M3_UNCEI|nr:hypothetical protein [Candidatus Eisenbacteria bacterium]
MPKPSVGSVHQNAALGRVAIGYRNPTYVLGHPTNGVFPSVSVKFENDDYYLWNAGEIFGNAAEVVAPGGRAPRGGFSHTTASYKLEEIKYSWAIPDRVRDNMDTAIMADLSATRRCMDKIQLYKELEIAGILTTTGNWGGSGDPAVKWDVYGTAVPTRNVEDASEAVRLKCGMRANTGVLSITWALHAMRSDELRDLIRYTGNPLGSLASFETLRIAFKLQRLLIVEAIYNSANPGQTASLGDVMGAHMWVGYVPNNPMIDEPSAGYTFIKGGPRVRTWREDAEEQDVVEAAYLNVTKVTASVAGYVITNLNT